jgi:hypothetical protein
LQPSLAVSAVYRNKVLNRCCHKQSDAEVFPYSVYLGPESVFMLIHQCRLNIPQPKRLTVESRRPFQKPLTKSPAHALLAVSSYGPAVPILTPPIGAEMRKRFPLVNAPRSAVLPGTILRTPWSATAATPSANDRKGL